MAIRGLDNLRAAGERVQRAWSDGVSREARAAVGAHITAATISRMNRYVTPDGQKHAPLTEAYKRRKKRQGYSTRIWQRTGESKRRVQILRYTRRGLVIAINTRQAYWMHHGRVKRPVLGLSRGDVWAIKRIVTADLGRKMTTDPTARLGRSRFGLGG